MPLISLRTSAVIFSSSLILFFTAPPSDASYFNPDESEKLIKESASLLNSGNYIEAERLLSEMPEKLLPDRRADFLLCRVNMALNRAENAEICLKKAADDFPLMKEHVFKLLADLYAKNGEAEKALHAAELIKSGLLKKEAMLIQASSLVALGRYDDAIETLKRFVSSYPSEWDKKWELASLLRKKGKDKEAGDIYKGLLIGASPFADRAEKELKEMKAGALSYKETLKRADNLFRIGEYRLAESVYADASKGYIDPLRKRIIYQRGMCNFRLKDYEKSSLIFGSIGTARAKYWQARSLLRAGRFSDFVKALNELEAKYPDDKHYAMAHLIYADELRRKGDIEEALKVFNKIIRISPANAEEALWGMAWMHYTAGDYESAIESLTKLSEYRKSTDYGKYVYWTARAFDKKREKCLAGSAGGDASKCSASGKDFVKDIVPDNNYYGFLVRFRYGAGGDQERLYPAVPERPGGEEFELVETLAFLGMRDDAAGVITALLSDSVKNSELLYLGYLAADINEYKSIIRFAENAEGKDFQFLSYPLAYWKTIEKSAGSKSVDPYLVEALIREESRFDNAALSWAGAYGLMQLMPATAERVKTEAGVIIHDKADLFDAEKNIYLGIEYLSFLLKEFDKLPFSIASYNAGENAVRGWLERFAGKETDEIIEDIPYTETRNYVKRVLKSYWRYRTLYGLTIEAY